MLYTQYSSNLPPKAFVTNNCWLLTRSCRSLCACLKTMIEMIPLIVRESEHVVNRLNGQNINPDSYWPLLWPLLHVSPAPHLIALPWNLSRAVCMLPLSIYYEWCLSSLCTCAWTLPTCICVAWIVRNTGGEGRGGMTNTTHWRAFILWCTLFWKGLELCSYLRCCEVCCHVFPLCVSLSCCLHSLSFHHSLSNWHTDWITEGWKPLLGHKDNKTHFTLLFCCVFLKLHWVMSYALHFNQLFSLLGSVRSRCDGFMITQRHFSHLSSPLKQGA